MGKVNLKFSKLIFYVFISLVMVSTNCDSAKHIETASDATRFRLIVSKMYMDPNNDNDIKLGGGGWGGDVIIRINENPIKINSYGGVLFEITHWVKPGENVLSFSGSMSKNLYFKIFSIGEELRVKKTIAAGFVKPEEINRYEKEFSIVSQYTPAFYRSEAIKKESRYELQLVAKIKKLHDMLADHDEDSFVQMMSGGANIWSKKIGASKQIKIKEKEMRETFFKHSNAKVEDLKLSELKIIWGNQSVLVYEGFDQPNSNLRDPYLFKVVMPDGKINYISPICLVFLNDKWIVWD